MADPSNITYVFDKIALPAPFVDPIDADVLNDPVIFLLLVLLLELMYPPMFYIARLFENLDAISISVGIYF